MILIMVMSVSIMFCIVVLNLLSHIENNVEIKKNITNKIEKENNVEIKKKKQKVFVKNL